MEESQWENYYKLPKIILDIMEWLCDTRFYNKTYLERKECFEEIKEKWKFCDFHIIDGTLEKPNIIKIGQIPHYKYDHEKAIIINFNNINNCYITRGWATGLYASKIISNNYDIPLYMKEDLENFIIKYKNI